MIKQNKKANFWIRLLASSIDLSLFVIFLIATSFMVFNYQKNTYYHIANYYVWLFLIITYLTFFYIVLPIIWKGKTIGLAICRLKIIKKDNASFDKFSKIIFDRQRLFAFLWICIFLSFIIFIHPQTFLEAAKKEKIKPYQKLFLSIPIVLSSLAIMLQIFLMFTNLKSDKIGLNDKFSNSLTVWMNKFEEIKNSKEEKILKEIRPKKRILPTLDFEN